MPNVEYLVFPRLAAVAELGWSPKGGKDWEAFLAGLDNYLMQLDQQGITYAKSMYNIDHMVQPSDGKLKVALSCIRPDVEIHYTNDGSEPQHMSALYADTLLVEAGAVVKAATFKAGKQLGKTLTLNLQKNKAIGCAVISKNEGDYVLTNGIRGSERHSDFEWTEWGTRAMACPLKV